MKKKIKVQGLEIRIEPLNDSDYISLTDIAKQSTEALPKNIIQNWLKNTNTIRFLYTWEKIHNANFNGIQMDAVISSVSDNRVIISPSKWIETTNAIGIRSRGGRYGGGTYAHSEIALNFCYWLSPEFQVYMWKEFNRLKLEEANRKNLQWDVKKITDNIDEIRNILDTIEGQDPARNRLHLGEEE